MLYVIREGFQIFTIKEYEEDFEEMDDSENEGEDEKETELPQVEEREKLTLQRRKEIEAIQRAMDEENERVGTVQSRQSTNREEEDKSKWSRGTVIICLFSHIYLLSLTLSDLMLKYIHD